MPEKKKYQDFAQQNLDTIEKLLTEYSPKTAESIQSSIEKFLFTAIQNKESHLSFPENFDPGLMSLVLTNMSLWLGNTQEAKKYSD